MEKKVVTDKSKLVAPVLKWLGGKRWLLNTLIPLLPQRVTTYCEPFVGGGALLFALQPDVAYVNDINADLINVYKVIKDDVESLITVLQDFKNDADCFYAVRDWDRDKTKYSALSDVQKAARILYLNKTCYNGLFRVNSAGEFNSPFGNYRNPDIVNAPTLRAVSSYFNKATIYLTSVDYAEVLKSLPKDTFVYLDPPYDRGSSASYFTGYSTGGFTRDDQVRLRESCDNLNRREIKFMLSNSATNFIMEQYSAYNIITVRARRSINPTYGKCREVDEVVIRNYE
jgi:DNA adenine methylase